MKERFINSWVYEFLMEEYVRIIFAGLVFMCPIIVLLACHTVRAFECKSLGGDYIYHNLHCYRIDEGRNTIYVDVALEKKLRRWDKRD